MEGTSGQQLGEISVLSSREVKKVLSGKKAEIPENDAWRISYLGLLLDQRQAAHYGGFEEELKRLSEMINSLCIN